jgi:hypothetical protein
MEIHTLVLNIKMDQLLPLVFLYIGPETILPLTSALAAIAGVLLIVWRQALALVRKIWRIFVRK